VWRLWQFGKSCGHLLFIFLVWYVSPSKSGNPGRNLFPKSTQVCYAGSDPTADAVLPILSESRKISNRMIRLTSRSGFRDEFPRKKFPDKIDLKIWAQILERKVLHPWILNRPISTFFFHKSILHRNSIYTSKVVDGEQ
jgi:hypothetical protein